MSPPTPAKSSDICSLRNDGFEPPTRVTRLRAHDHVWRSHGHHGSAFVTALWSHVDNPVGQLDHVEIVLNEDERVPLVKETVKNGGELEDVFKMQAGRGFIEDVQLACARARSAASPTFRGTLGR